MEMTHRLFAVVLKAESENDVMKKAHVTMINIMNDPENMTRDAYWIFDSEEDINKSGGNEGTSGGSFRHRCNDKSHEHDDKTVHIKTSRLDSPEGQKFFKETINADHQIYPGELLCDEQGMIILDGSSYMGNKEYFIVPVDVHS
jgi:hypothetical protein